MRMVPFILGTTLPFLRNDIVSLQFIFLNRISCWLIMTSGLLTVIEIQPPVAEKNW